ncbi:MAG: T9SS type A sorting domain-containing protein [Melioribacteraceae bacterium]|nr:T9SS type A sorting domain-containing protein [Melioribacteraceae bacterium]
MIYNSLSSKTFLYLILLTNWIFYGGAADCLLAPTSENFIGVRYKAYLAENELSETEWMLLFGGSGFTLNGEYQPHFIDLMIKGSWVNIYDDEFCTGGFPAPQQTLNNFTVEFGISDYEDETKQDNDIGVWTNDPIFLPRVFTNIDSFNPSAADKIMTEFQVNKGGFLEGREIEVSFVRAEQKYLPRDKNYFMDPDLNCLPNRQADILYRRWIATLTVPSLGIQSTVDFYINALQGDKLTGRNILNFMWENPGKPYLESDKYKVIIFDPEVMTLAGEWKKATKFLVDYRTPDQPTDSNGKLVGGYRKVTYNNHPAIEASFGYGYTDYVSDANLFDYEPTDATKGIIDLDETVNISNGDIQLQEHFELSQNSPNPFNSITKIKFGLPESAHIKLIIYDILGREVSTLVNKELEAGYHEKNLSSGVYLYRLSTPKFTSVKKLLLMK